MAKRIISAMLAVAIIFCMLPASVLNVAAVTYPIGGTVKSIAGTLNIRKSASTSSNVIGSLSSGNTVTVLGEATGSSYDGSTLWYKIQLSSGVGYVHSVFIILDEPTPTPPSATDDADFEKLLDAQGFPESYRPMLRALHKKYPNWKFQALKTGLDWNKVVAAEYRLSDSLIDKSASASWKSYDQGRYSFSTSSFVTFDGGSYHAASKEYLMYCLDPRNFLTETDALMFLVAYGQTGETAEGAAKILSSLNWAKTYPDNNEVIYIYEDGSYDIILDNKVGGVEFSPTKTIKEKIEINSYGKAFYAAYKITGISAYMMASRIRQEQGANGNLSGMGKVEGYIGYYNLWNMNTSGENKFVKGAQYAKEQGWDTPLKSIIGGSVKLATNYFKTGQDTLYLQKYDVVDGGNGYYWHEYMTYLPAPWQEAKILKLAFTSETIQNEAVFKIPIYNNMPSSAVPCPTSSGTNNNYLKSISIGGNVIPNFDVYTQSYTDIIISSPTSTIDVSAVAYDSGATITGVGKLALKFGVNNIGIEVKASNGSVRKYTVSVVLNEETSGGDTTPTPAIGTTTLNIGSYITKIEPSTTVDAFTKALAVSNGTVWLLNSGGTKKAATDIVATGDTVVIYDTKGNEYLRYQTVIYGDVDGNGKVNSIDLLKAQRYIVGLDTLADAKKIAVDSNKDGKYNSVDLLITQRFIVGITKSIQGE